MNTEIARQIFMSPFPQFAAECRWNDEQRYGSRAGLQRRLTEMTQAGILSEVLDLIEALEMLPQKATETLITTYEHEASSGEQLSQFYRNHGNLKLAEENAQFAQREKNRANDLRNGTRTIDEELAARREERERIGFPDNYYVTLLSNPVFSR